MCSVFAFHDYILELKETLGRVVFTFANYYYTSYYIGDEENGVMAMHGTVGKFQQGRDDWSTYVEQLHCKWSHYR